MQIEQNFRDEKSERFGFGMRASHSHLARTYQSMVLVY
jgi:prolyl-tRNA synthetase